jgi:hypothetical protein
MPCPVPRTFTCRGSRSASCGLQQAFIRRRKDCKCRNIVGRCQNVCGSLVLSSFPWKPFFVVPRYLFVSQSASSQISRIWIR